MLQEAVSVFNVCAMKPKTENEKKMKMKMKIVYSVWQQCMLDSHNYNKIQTQIRQ